MYWYVMFSAVSQQWIFGRNFRTKAHICALVLKLQPKMHSPRQQNFDFVVLDYVLGSLNQMAPLIFLDFLDFDLDVL